MKDQSKYQKILSSKSVDRIYIELIESTDHSSYLDKDFIKEIETPKGETNIPDLSDIQLITDEKRGIADLENTKIVYDALRTITPTQASDPRLWTFLTHVTFRRYMQWRWPVDEAKEPINRIRDRYFLRKINLESLTRNGLSRLWWYGSLTYDENRENPWELTEVLLSRADLAVGITERAIGCNKETRTALLEYLLENPNTRKSEEQTRELLKQFNLLGGVKNLPFLAISELKDELKRIQFAA